MPKDQMPDRVFLGPVKNRHRYHRMFLKVISYNSKGKAVMCEVLLDQSSLKPNEDYLEAYILEAEDSDISAPPTDFSKEDLPNEAA